MSLQRYTAASPATSAPSSRGAGAEPGTSYTVESTSDDTWKSGLPESVYRKFLGSAPTGTLVAERAAPPVALRRDGGYVQAQLAWRATDQGALVLVVERRLRERHDGRLSPVEPWAVAHEDHRRFAQPKVWRHPELPSKPLASGGTSSGPEGALKDPDTELAWELLPAATQRLVSSLCPDHETENGLALVRFNRGERRAVEQVRYARFTSERFAAVLAERPRSNPPKEDRSDAGSWTVQVVGGPTAAPSDALASGQSRRALTR